MLPRGNGTGLNFPYAVIIEIRTKSYNRVVQDCEHEGPHYGVTKNLRAAKRRIPLQLKNSFAVLIDLIFAARLTEFFVLG